MRSRFNLFQRLGWKLTLSYTLVTVTAVLVLEIAGFALLLFVASRSPAINLVARELAVQMAATVRPFLDAQKYNPQEVSAWLQATYPSDAPGSNMLRFDAGPENQEDGMKFNLGQGDLVAVTGSAGEFVAANKPSALVGLNVGQPFTDSQAVLESRRLVEQALEGEPVSITLRNQAILAAAPVKDQDGRLLGTVYVRLVSLLPGFSAPLLLAILKVLGLSALVFTLGAGAIGTLFGFFTARGLSRRLSTFSSAADSWSRGDFSAFVRDPSGDELGQLARHLNHMAEQLQNLLQARQELASLEERNRLARDLHDSVKQQVFATAMQVGAACALLERDPLAAREHLVEAEQLALQAQTELNNLIRELRPATLQGRGLTPALKEYAASWSRQNNISLEFSLQGERSLPLAVEQALFRIAQEALANVARHSAASQAAVHLVWQGDRVTMTITDNGCGFDFSTMRGQGIGLRSMGERAEAMGGRLDVKSSPGQGTRITVTIDSQPGTQDEGIQREE